MNEAFKRYFEAIGLSTETMMTRIQALIDQAVQMLHREVVDVFVNNYFREDGTIAYTDLELITNDLLVSFHDFAVEQSEQVMTVVGIPANYPYFRIAHNSYDLKKATEKSRLSVELRWGDSGSWQYRAAGANCDYLMAIVRNRFSPRTGR